MLSDQPVSLLAGATVSIELVTVRPSLSVVVYWPAFVARTARSPRASYTASSAVVAETDGPRAAAAPSAAGLFATAITATLLVPSRTGTVTEPAPDEKPAIGVTVPAQVSTRYGRPLPARVSVRCTGALVWL